MLHEDVAFKTISDHYTNSRMVPFLTHIDEFRANFFKEILGKKDTHYGKSTVFFFTVKLDATNSFFLIRQRYDLSI